MQCLCDSRLDYLLRHNYIHITLPFMVIGSDVMMNRALVCSKHVYSVVDVQNLLCVVALSAAADFCLTSLGELSSSITLQLIFMP